jgi:hypothetical protein
LVFCNDIENKLQDDLEDFHQLQATHDVIQRQLSLEHLLGLFLIIEGAEVSQ